MTKILIVDDEPLVVISLRTMIENCGGDLYVTGECTNGKEAYEYIVSHPETDIVITDVDMPVMDGLELAGKLKTGGFRQSLLFLSAYRNFNYAREAFLSGAADYILKTELEPEKLKRILYSIIDARKAAGLLLTGKAFDGTIEKRRQFFRYLLDAHDPDNPAALHPLFETCRFTVPFPLYFMIVRPGDIPEVIRRYGKALSDFRNNTCGLLRQFAAPRGGDVADIEYDQYCILMKDEDSLEDTFSRFYDSAWTYLDTGFERRISSRVDDFSMFAALYPETAEQFLSFSRAVVRARRYIHEHYADRHISLTDIARYAEISSNRLSGSFSKETGETVIEFLARTRIRAAGKMLQETDMKMFEIAGRTGFSNVETFCRVFKKVTGTNPGKIRQ